jgi:hypothetical protein
MSEVGHSRRSDGQQGFADVPYAFNGDRICASQRTDAMYHKRASKVARLRKGIESKTVTLG